MEQKHLKRAQEIVDDIAERKLRLSFEGPFHKQANTLYVEKQGPGVSPVTNGYPMSRAVRDAAFKVWRREQELRLAALRREAAQIGLKLED